MFICLKKGETISSLLKEARKGFSAECARVSHTRNTYLLTSAKFLQKLFNGHLNPFLL